MSSVHALLARARRRLRALWLVATVAWAAPVLGALALGLVVVGRVRPWTWPEPAALALAVAALVAIGVSAVVLRVPDDVVARAADRGLGTRDAFATALERDSSAGILDDRVRARAEELGRDADLRRALPLRPRVRRLLTGGSLAALALVAGIAANPQDDVRRQRAAEQALVDDAADAVAEAAAELDETTPPTDEGDPAVAELEALADALAEASTLEEAESLLDRSEAALQSGLSPDALARKAAVSGLEQSLEAEPLPGAPAGADAAAQLEAAAGHLDALDDQEATALAERLERLADTLGVGNPDAAAALAQAAAALREGRTADASGALGDAAAAQRSAAAATAADDSRRSALGAVGEARQALEGGDAQAAGAGEGAGEGGDPGSGSGSGSGEGEGQGEGNGSGAGEGQGQGQGQGQGGSPSGEVAGAPGGNGAGQGGQGTPGDSPGGNPVGEESRTDEPSIFDPAVGDGDELDLGGTPTDDDPGEVAGRGDGQSSRGAAFVPLSEAVEEFRDRVTHALDDPGLSPSMRELVRAYFGRLTEGS